MNVFEINLNTFFMNSPYGVNECADICTDTTTEKYGNLTGCTLTFTSSMVGGCYGIALQVIILYSILA